MCESCVDLYATVIDTKREEENHTPVLFNDILKRERLLLSGAFFFFSPLFFSLLSFLSSLSRIIKKRHYEYEYTRILYRLKSLNGICPISTKKTPLVANVKHAISEPPIK